MTSRNILRHLRQGRAVVLSSDPWSCFCRDLFGTLIIESRRRREDMPPRVATLSDKRAAVLFAAIK